MSAYFKEQQQEVDLFERQSSLRTHYVQARTSTVNVDCKLPWFTRSGVVCEGTYENSQRSWGNGRFRWLFGTVIDSFNIAPFSAVEQTLGKH